METLPNFNRKLFVVASSLLYCFCVNACDGIPDYIGGPGFIYESCNLDNDSEIRLSFHGEEVERIDHFTNDDCRPHVVYVKLEVKEVFKGIVQTEIRFTPEGDDITSTEDAVWIAIDADAPANFTWTEGLFNVGQNEGGYFSGLYSMHFSNSRLQVLSSGDDVTGNVSGGELHTNEDLENTLNQLRNCPSIGMESIDDCGGSIPDYHSGQGFINDSCEEDENSETSLTFHGVELERFSYNLGAPCFRHQIYVKMEIQEVFKGTVQTEPLLTIQGDNITSSTEAVWIAFINTFPASFSWKEGVFTVTNTSSSFDGAYSIFASSDRLEIDNSENLITGHVYPGNLSTTEPLAEVLDQLRNCNIATGIDSHKNQSIELYPNPTQDYFQFSNAMEGDFQIYNVSGTLIHSGTALAKERIDVSFLETGYYFVRVKSRKENTSSNRLIVY